MNQAKHYIMCIDSFKKFLSTFDKIRSTIVKNKIKVVFLEEYGQHVKVWFKKHDEVRGEKVL